MDTPNEFDSRKWLHDVLGPHGDRTKRMEKILHILKCSATNHVYKKWLGPKAKQLSREQVVAIAKILGVPNPLEAPEMQLPPNFAIYPFVGAVRAGHFAEPEMISQVARDPIISKRHPVYPKAQHMAWLVEGDSMDAKGYVEGAAALGVNFQQTSRTLKDGDIVVVERVRDGNLVERTLKVVKKIEGGIELQPRSTNPVHKPIVIKEKDLDDGTEIKVLTLIYRGELPPTD